MAIRIWLFGGLLLFAVSTSRTSRYNRTWVLVHLDIFLNIEAVTIQIWLIGGLLLLAVSTSRYNRTRVLVHLDILFYI